MNYRKLCTILFVLSFSGSVCALEQNDNGPIKQLLFKPELIMKHRAELDLDPDQQATLKAELQRTQATVFDLKWQMREESEALAEILKQTPIDETELLVQAGKVMTLEQQIKKAHLVLLARLKNMLTERQVEMLKEFRKTSH
jgi:Spy/CpxP family protein refolding chaperone